MLESRKRKMQYLCTGVLCFFSLFSCAAAALAWFVNVKTVRNDDILVETTNIDIHAQYFIYKYDKDNKYGTNIDESVDTSQGGDTSYFDIKNFKLNTYDTIFVAQNKFTPAIIRIRLYGKDLPAPENDEEQDITVRIHRDLTFTDDSVTQVDDGENIAYYYKSFSNVGNFGLSIPSLDDYASYSAYNDTVTGDNVKTFFSDAITTFKGSGITTSTTSLPTINGKTFFNTTNDVTSKVNTLSLHGKYSSTLQTTEIDPITNESYTANNINLYVCVDYDLTLLQKFTSTTNISLSAGIGDLDIELENDLTTIDVKLGVIN